MSSTTPPGTTPPASVPAATKVPAAAKPVFRVQAGHDWGHFEATDGEAARIGFLRYFGIRTTAHDTKIDRATSMPEVGKRFSHEKPLAAASAPTDGEAE